jgi:hypothetical protein
MVWFDVAASFFCRNLHLQKKYFSEQKALSDDGGDRFAACSLVFRWSLKHRLAG